jgi:endo-1,4-beta-mannosidase
MSEQYAALGRFVTVFENTVNLIRTATVGMLASNRRYEKLVNIAFHSSVMTAEPLFQVFRAVVGQIVTDEEFGFPKQQGQDILSVMNQIAGEFDAI